LLSFGTDPNPEYLDESEDRIHVVYVDGEGTMHELAETAPLVIRTTDFGAPSGRMWVDYCSDEMLRVYINPTGDEKPAEAQVVVPFELSTIFQGNDVVVGYTAGTWAQADYQDILDWKMTQLVGDACPV